MNTTDTQFDRLAEIAQEAVDALKQAIERAEAAEAERDSNKELYDAWYRKHLRKLEAVKAERDALQARIDAGVRVWGKDLGNGEWCWSYTEYHTIDTHTAILIDPKPIADHVPDAGKMMDDDRKNDTDRRFGFARGSCWRINQTDDTRGKYRTAVPNTRRRTPGTKADRKPSWTRADGSATPRKGERRKGLEKCFTNPERGIEFWMDEVNLLHDEQRDPSGANDRRRNK